MTDKIQGLYISLLIPRETEKVIQRPVDPDLGRIPTLGAITVTVE